MCSSQLDQTDLYSLSAWSKRRSIDWLGALPMRLKMTMARVARMKPGMI